MLIIIAATMIALASIYIVMKKSHKTDPAQLSEPRPAVPTMGIQIICGDCSGDEARPMKTYLDRYGNCSTCGGHSYLLASTLALHALEQRVARLAEYAKESSNGRVIPFEAPAAARARAEKIAV